MSRPLPLPVATWQKLQIFKIQDDGRPPFWKSLNRHNISVKNYQISMKFGTLQQMLIWTRLQSRDQKLKVLKFKMAAIAILKIAFFGRNTSTDGPISAKFCMRKQNRMPTKATWKNCKFLKSKMANGRHFENRFIAISQWKIFRFQWNLVHNIRYWTQWQSRDKKLKFLKFNMAAAAILKIAFLAVIHRPIAERHVHKG